MIVRQFRDAYNQIRPHSSLDYQTPATYRAKMFGQAARSGQARQAGPFLRPQLAVPSSSHHNN